MLPIVSLNWLAILLAAVASFVISAIWYSPALFGNAWMKSIGMSMKDMSKMGMSGSKMAKSYVIMFVAALLMSFVLSVLIHLLGASSVQSALEVGLFVWLGFVATEKISGVLFEGRHFNYYTITVLQYLITILAMSLILSLWF